VPRRRAWAWLALAVLAVVAVAAYVHFDVGQRFDLEWMQRKRSVWLARYEARPLATLALFFAAYVLVNALPLPGLVGLAPVAGAVLGLWLGTVLVSFAAALGALLAFLAARHVFRDAVQRRFGRRLASVNEGIERDGAWYVMSLHFAPAMPSFLVNLLAAVTPMRARRFYWATQVGMLPGVAAWVNAGTHLGALERLSDALSPALLGSLTLLAIVPLLGRWLVRRLGARRTRKEERRSRPFR
jgi:uncharacterized membrane protein YdjX (TVP38/TMEM64 family)